MMDNIKMRILIADSVGFLGKYVRRQLEATPLAKRQEIIEVADGGREATEADAVIVIAQGEIAVGKKLTLTLPPAVIGTGMTGTPMEMARLIDGGLYFHLAGCRARVTTVHAVDVARAVVMGLAGGIEGRYRLTDSVDPLRADLAEALAHRMGQKRLYTLSGKAHRRLARLGDLLGFLPFSSKRLSRLTADELTTGVGFAEACQAWMPVNTIDYLKTHDYGNDDF